MALQAPVINEFQMAKDELFAIPEVEKVYAQSLHSRFDVTVILPDNNPEVIEKVIEVEANIISHFSWLDVDFDIIFLCGRALNEVVSPKGTLLFER